MRRVIVVGAGVIGLLCAYELSRRGATVTVLDKGEPGAGCSAGNSGWIVPSLSTPLPAPGLVKTSLTWMLKRESPVYIRFRMDPALIRWLWGFWQRCNEQDYRRGVTAMAGLNKHTMALYDALEADGIEFEMHRSGLLFVFVTETAMRNVLEDLGAMAAQCGYQSPRTLTAEEVRHLEPGLSRNICGGILIGEERHLRPESLTAGLKRRLSELGVEVRPGIGVTGVQRIGRNIKAVTAGDRVFEADQFLIAAGAWSGPLAKQLECPIPIQAGAGYSVTVPNPALKLQRSIYLFEAKVACSPFHGALRIAGTMELCGIDAAFNPGRLAAMQRATNSYLPGWQDGGPQSEWMGMRPLTPDGLPVIGRAPGYDNAYFATGHAMLGITLAPATAAVIAEAMCSGRESPEFQALSPTRFLK